MPRRARSPRILSPKARRTRSRSPARLISEIYCTLGSGLPLVLFSTLWRTAAGHLEVTTTLATPHPAAYLHPVEKRTKRRPDPIHPHSSRARVTVAPAPALPPAYDADKGQTYGSRDTRHR